MAGFGAIRRLLAAAGVIGLFGLAGCATQAPAPRVTLAIAQTERGVMVWLPDNVLFEFGKSSLNTLEAGPYLDRVAQLLKEKTSVDIELDGHTDNVGSAGFNQSLSERRAGVVRDALTQRGVPEARMKIVGMGLSKPLAPNDTETGRKLNRRVEIILLDETVGNLSQGEPEGAFEQAFDRLKRLLEEAPDRAGR